MKAAATELKNELFGAVKLAATCKGLKAVRTLSVIAGAGTAVSSQPTVPKVQLSALFEKNNYYNDRAGGSGTFLVFCG